MSDRTIAAYDVSLSLHSAVHAANDPISEAKGMQEVNEEREFYIPNLLSDEDYEPDPEARYAAEAHTRDLRKVDRGLDEALNLSRVLRASMSEAGDSRAMQAETVLKIVEKKLTNAHNRIDKHEMKCTNLFLAYFDLRGKSDERTR